MTKFRVSRLPVVFVFLLISLAITCSAQTETTIFNFDGTNGSYPDASVIQAADGNFYGTTSAGGTGCCGTVFKLTPQGVLTTLYNFCSQQNCADGESPYGGLIQGNDGNFYGTTTQGGVFDQHGGTIFKITPSGRLTTLYSFCAQTNCTDGNYPTAGLIQGLDGNFYGTTFDGGVGDVQYCQGGCGTVFKITPNGEFTILHSFAGYPTEGSAPNGGLVLGPKGSFYGTTQGGGAYNLCLLGCGTVFEIKPDGTFTTLYSFAGPPSDGAQPSASLLLALNGNFYGTTQSGGTGNYGTIFKINSSGVFTSLYSFCAQPSCTDGGQPMSALVQTTDGNIYGTALRGGTNGVGSVFKISSTGTLVTAYSFCAAGYPNCTDGSFPDAGLLQDTNGNLYGTTSSGGTANCGFGSACGVIFELSTGLAPFIRAQPVAGRVGLEVALLGTNLSGITGVSFNGVAAPFTVRSPSLIVANIPSGAATGYISVTTSTGKLRSNTPFYVIP